MDKDLQMTMADAALCAELIESLQSQDPDVVRKAAFEAGICDDPQITDLLVKHIQSSHLGVREAAEFSLRAIRGKRVVQGVAGLLRADDAAVRNVTMDILREIGSDDLDTLHALLTDSDGDVRIFIADILGQSGTVLSVGPLIEALQHDEDVNVRHQAASSLGNLGFPEAVKALEASLNDDEWVQFASVEALSKIRDSSCVGALSRSLEHVSDLVASIIIRAFGDMGDVKAVPLLLKYLDVPSVPLRNQAIKSVIQILGSSSLELLDSAGQGKLKAHLMDILDDEDESFVLTGLTGLASLGDAAATQKVLDLAQRTDPDANHMVYEAALQCLVGIGFNEEVEKALQSGEESIVQVAVQVCGAIGSTESLQALKSIFWSCDRNTQRIIAAFLGRHGSADDMAFFEDVIENHTDPTVSKGALLFLGQHGDVERHGEKMMAFLGHKYNDVREVAFHACLQLQAASLYEGIMAFKTSSDSFKRVMAIQVMGHLNVLEYLDDVCTALEDESSDVRKAALYAIGAVCDEHPELFDRLSPRLYDQSNEVRLTLVNIAGEHNSTQALQLLMAALHDEDDWVKIRAMESLSEKSPPNLATMLINELENSSVLVTIKIIEILGIIGDNVAFMALLKLINQTNPDIQQAAENALIQIQEQQGGEF